MRFLANENVPGPLVRALVEAGSDVVRIRQVSPGISDRKVIERAAEEDRVLITFDKDFGELARSVKLPATSGIIPFRTPMPPYPDIGRLADAILARRDWAGRFSVIEPGHVRSRPLGTY